MSVRGRQATMILAGAAVLVVVLLATRAALQQGGGGNAVGGGGAGAVQAGGIPGGINGAHAGGTNGSSAGTTTGRGSTGEPPFAGVNGGSAESGSAAAGGGSPGSAANGSDPATAPGAADPTPGANAPSPLSPPPSYRPASTLKYSDALPAPDRSGDDASPILARILKTTEATAEQQERIRDLWHTHEDARRALLAATPPRASGPVILDRQKLGPVDFAFESQLFTRVLNPAQRDRLALEVYPAAPPRR